MRPLSSSALGHVLLALSWVVIGSACGGSQSAATGPAGAKSRADTAEGESSASEETAGCSDETCFTCGSIMCLKGFYCDQGLSAGPACSWLPECGPKASCSCVQGVLGSGCSCEERDNGVYVSCK